MKSITKNNAGVYPEFFDGVGKTVRGDGFGLFFSAFNQFKINNVFQVYKQLISMFKASMALFLTPICSDSSNSLTCHSIRRVAGTEFRGIPPRWRWSTFYIGICEWPAAFLNSYRSALTPTFDEDDEFRFLTNLLDPIYFFIFIPRDLNTLFS